MRKGNAMPFQIGKRTLLPALCLVLAGCVYVPVISPERSSAKIGATPKQVVRVGEADRDLVLKEFGKPTYSTQNDLAWGYLRNARIGTATGLLMGPCMPYFGSSDVWSSDDVWLEFDDGGHLRRVEKRLLRRCKYDAEAAWRTFTKSVPDNIRSEQMRSS